MSLPRIALPPGAFGRFERVDLLLFLCGYRGNVRSQVAVAVFPFLSRVRARRTIPAGAVFQFTVAAVATLYGLMTNPAIVGTPLFGHKWAFASFSNCCALHWNHPQLNRFCVNKNGLEYGIRPRLLLSIFNKQRTIINYCIVVKPNIGKSGILSESAMTLDPRMQRLGVSDVDRKDHLLFFEYCHWIIVCNRNGQMKREGA